MASTSLKGGQPDKPDKPDKPDNSSQQHSVRRGDEVYFTGPAGVNVGKVVCHGKHGATLDCDGQRTPVRWEHLLGHKARASFSARVVDQGEDGMVVEDETGERSFLAGQLPDEQDELDPGDEQASGQSEQTEPQPEPTNALYDQTLIERKPQSEWEKMTKSMPVLFFLKGMGVSNRPGLALQQTTDRAGHSVKRWKKTSQDQKKEREPAKQEAPKQQDGQQEQGGGRQIAFHHHATGEKTTGTIAASGADGVTVHDKDGNEHHIKHGDYHPHTGDEPKQDGPQAGQQEQDAQPAEDKPDGMREDPETFSAAAFYVQHNDENATPESIIAQFPGEVKQKLDAIEPKAAEAFKNDTQSKHKKGGQYSKERSELHQKIIDQFLGSGKLEAARPKEGDSPTFTILGGRGGSGKSWFEGNVFEPSKNVVLDADAIKQMLPEYDGWNACEVHEESGDIFDRITDICIQNGVNLVHDATMKTTHKAVSLVNRFKDQNYRVEAHYMHLPRQEAAKRAVARFMGKSGRYVPPSVVLSNTDNEKSFDAVKRLANKWSFRDNNVAKGEAPILISEGENGQESEAGQGEVRGQLGDGLQKSIQGLGRFGGRKLPTQSKAQARQAREKALILLI